MKTFFDRVRRIWSRPGYRTRLLFFGVLGVAVILFSKTNVADAYWDNFLQEFAAIFVAIPLIQFLWDFVGGDPTEEKINELHQQIQAGKQEIENLLAEKFSAANREIDSLKHSVHVVADLIDHNLGIERIWADRRNWQFDETDGSIAWQERLTSAHAVDMMSSTLWQSWMRPSEFREDLFKNVANGATLRILIYDPESPVLRMRAEDEGDMGQGQEMRSEILSALSRLARHWKNLDENARKRVEVRLTHRFIHFSQIIRADNYMLVANYLSGASGGPSPTMQLRGPETAYFKKYLSQFETVWERARVVTPEELLNYLRQYGEVKPPPQEE